MLKLSELLSQETSDVTGTCETHGEWSQVLPKSLAKHAKCQECAEDERKESDRLAAESREMEYAQNIKRKNTDAAAIPHRYKTKTFDTYKPTTPNATKALEQAMAYTADFKQNLEAGSCVIMSGNVGTGKTHLSCAICNQLLERGASVKYISLTNLIRSFRATWTNRDLSESDVLSEYTRYHLLAIDEIGVQRGTEDEKLILFDVINARYEEMMPTLIITNLSKSELPAAMGERTLDRLRENNGKLISFDWDSNRT